MLLTLEDHTLEVKPEKISFNKMTNHQGEISRKSLSGKN